MIIEPTDPMLVRLARRLAEPLPGIVEQRTMAPPGRIGKGYRPDPPDSRQSAVLVLVTGSRNLVFIRRANDGGPHSGQIAFPGGAREKTDPDLQTTALRETEEEIGLDRGTVRVLGRLSPLYISVSNYTVHPFVGAVDALSDITCQPDEVDEVIELPIHGFASSLAELRVKRDTTEYVAPCYRLGLIDVWGATAMITAEFLSVWGMEN